MRKTLPSNRSDIQFEYRVRIDITRIVRPLSNRADIHLRIPNAGISNLQSASYRLTTRAIKSLANVTCKNTISTRINKDIADRLSCKLL